MDAVKKKKRGRWFRRLLLTVSLCVLAFLLFFAVRLFQLDAWHEFDPDKILGADQTLILYDGEQNEIVRLHSTEDRVMVALEDIPYLTRMAFVSAEDARFYDHIGVDFIRIVGAAWADLKAGGYVQGASTISQQLIKLSHLTAEKTITRKLEEAVLAYQMERQFSKDEILEMYLNYVYFGGGYYGIEAAALGYFGVHASELDISQSAMLAGILKAPGRFAPHIDYDASIGRRNVILSLMQEYGYIDADTVAVEREKEPVILHDPTNTAVRGYYVDTAISSAARLLGVSQNELLTGGYRIYTCMDAEAQYECERIFAESEAFPTDNVQAAIVLQRAGTGEVAALMGGRDGSAAMSFNRATSIRRQPGSLIKPIICYAPALEYSGYTAASILLDEPTSFGDYSPGNNNDKYYGYVTLRQAVTKSLNIPAVKVLSDVGLTRCMAFAKSCGVEFSIGDESLALALGGFTYGVSPLQMAGAYSMLASGGEYSSPTVIRSITDASGNVLYKYEPECERLMCEENAFILTSMLESVISDGTGRRLGELGIPLAGKTGTVGGDNGNRDAWMAAYNSEYTAVVWMGYDDNNIEYLSDDATGGKYPALILYELFASLYDDTAAPGFEMPEGVVIRRLDGSTMQTHHRTVLANALTPASSVYKEYFKLGTEPDEETDYWVIPSRPGGFAVSVDEAGKPVITFNAVQEFVSYALYREGGSGEPVLLKSWSGITGRQTYTDQSVMPGAEYVYYIVPVHMELTVNGKKVTGLSTRSITVETPLITPTELQEDIDFTG